MQNNKEICLAKRSTSKSWCIYAPVPPILLIVASRASVLRVTSLSILAFILLLFSALPTFGPSGTGEGRAEMGEVVGEISLSMLRIPSLILFVAAARLSETLNVLENINDNPDFYVNPVRGEPVLVLVLRGVDTGSAKSDRERKKPLRLAILATREPVALAIFPLLSSTSDRFNRRASRVEGLTLAGVGSERFRVGVLGDTRRPSGGNNGSVSEGSASSVATGVKATSVAVRAMHARSIQGGLGDPAWTNPQSCFSWA